MKRTISGNGILLLALLFATQYSYSQQGFGTEQPSRAAVIEMSSTSKGLLIPRVGLTSLDDFDPIKGESAIDPAKVNSLLVYNTATAGTAPNNVTPGYYYWTTNGTTGQWHRLVNDTDIAALGSNVTADNGLTITGNNIQLGGTLEDHTEIDLDGNTLAIKDLPTGHTTDRILVADPTTGVLGQLKAAMPKFFYMPSIIMPTDPSQAEAGEYSSTTAEYTINLHAKYKAQFETTELSSPSNTHVGIRSAGAPHLPVLPKTELYYYITWWDDTVFEEVQVSDEGVLTYKVSSTADITVGSFMNIVFAVKD